MSKLAARKKRVKRTVSIGRVVPEAVGQVEDLGIAVSRRSNG